MNRPVPIAPPMAIICSCRGLRAFVVALIFLSQRRRVVVDRDPIEGTLGVGTETRNSETVKVRLHKDLA